MSAVVFVLSWPLDSSGMPHLKFFPAHEIVEAVEYAVEEANNGRHVGCAKVPTFDEEKSDGRDA